MMVMMMIVMMVTMMIMVTMMLSGESMSSVRIVAGSVGSQYV